MNACIAMRVVCCIPGCNIIYSKNCGIAFHRIPKGLKSLWTQKVINGLHILNFFTLNDNDKICSKHFIKDDYLDLDNLYGNIVGNRNTFASDDDPQKFASKFTLKRNAYPTVFEFNKRLSLKRKITTDHTDHDSTIVLTRLPAKSQHLTTLQEDASVQSHEIFTQTCEDLPSILAELRLQLLNTKRILKRRDAEIVKLKTEIDLLKKTASSPTLHTELDKIIASEVECDTDLNSTKASFLLEQLSAFSQARHNWHDSTLREAVIWQATSPNGYEYARNNILKLPHVTTLRRYVGPVDGKVGVNDLIKERLATEIKQLNSMERFGSLLIDEMSLSEKLIYDKNHDRFYGHVENGLPGTSEGGTSKLMLANHLLCFVLEGLSTRYIIPVAYYFTRSLKGKELTELVKDVLHSVESSGFHIVRIVADNHKINTAMFAALGDGTLQCEIPHPCDTSTIDARRLFLSFDPNHIIKNLRNQFLERRMWEKHGEISSSYVRKLYHLQKKEVIKPVRFLTSKHINPSNFEKMNVQRAVQLFSPEVSASIDFLRINSTAHANAHEFKYASATVRYLEVCYKWWQIHNVSNRTHFIQIQDQNKMHFFDVSDERLCWLEVEYPAYLEEIGQESLSRGFKFMSKETHEAVIHTSFATAKCVRYLLNQNFHFVLTRYFNSDPIESVFGALRQMCGFNDVVDVRSAVNALEKIVKIGIIKQTTHGNTYEETDQRKNSLKKIKPKVCDALPEQDEDLQQQELAAKFQEHILVSEATPLAETMRAASTALVAGYISRVIKEEASCRSCQGLLEGPQTPSTLLSLIHLQDRGSLVYPKPEFVKILCTIHDFVMEVMASLNHSKRGMQALFASVILPQLKEMTIFQCDDKDDVHTTAVCETVTDRFLSPLMKNYAKQITDNNSKSKVENKPLSRKVLKL